MRSDTRERPGGRSPSLSAYRALTSSLAAGRWPPGSLLPSERALAEELGVSRTTLRHALKELADAGFLEPAPQRGWFVARAYISEGPNLLAGFSEAAAARGLTAGSRIVSADVRPCAFEVAEVLGIPPASEVVVLERVRTLDGLPVAVQTLSLPHRLVPDLHRALSDEGSLYRLLIEKYGLAPSRCDYTLQAEAATSHIAQLLDIAPESPVLVGHEVTIDTQDRVMAAGRMVYRGDAYRFTATLFRL
ncbi:MAG: GntR family transcriptional regulator [Actinomycetales bacterium]|nr:GntR family transcriptional regulator [Actinomycetales bacterium]